MTQQLSLFNKTEEESPDAQNGDLLYAKCNECNEPFAVCNLCGKVFETGDRYYCHGKEGAFKQHFCKECNKKKSKRSEAIK
ncbi:MAG TPA: hypothetical protein ENH82_04790 [bacterium]|nr:hypothetical protein [bacterium]